MSDIRRIRSHIVKGGPRGLVRYIQSRLTRYVYHIGLILHQGVPTECMGVVHGK